MKIIEIIEDKDTLELPNIEVGDEVKIGKWKNRKATVKGFKKDKKDNHPVLKTTKGDTKLFKPRITKIEEGLPQYVDWDALNEFTEKVRKDCKRYLSNKSPGMNLIRGVSKHDGYEYIYNKIIQKERARTSSWDGEFGPARNKALSDLMKEDGFTATRSNGVFCFGVEGSMYDPNEVGLHGTPYIIFPIGRYSLTWYDRNEMYGRTHDIGSGGWYHDMVSSQFDGENAWSKAPTGAPKDREADLMKNVAAAFWDKYKHAFSHGINVDQAVKSESEVIVAGTGYHAMDARHYFQLLATQKDLII